MNKKNNASLGLVLLFWCMTAYAQYVSKPSFGDELLAVSTQTWFFVALFGLIGIAWRITDTLRKKERATWVDYVAIVFIGYIAAYVGFEVCNTWRFRWGLWMSDGVQGGVIIIFAHNHERWLDWFTSRVEAFAEAFKAVGSEKKP